MGDGRAAGGKPQVKKATFESTKKKEIGVSDLTLLSKISNEAINENLKLRFDHDEIYVRSLRTRTAGLGERDQTRMLMVVYRPTSDMCWSLSIRSAIVSDLTKLEGW